VRQQLTDVVLAAYSDGNAVRGAVAADGLDARLTADIDVLATDMSALFAGVVKPVAEVVGLTASLGSLMGWANLARCYASFVALGAWSRWVSAPVQLSAATSAEAEAALRAAAHGAAEFAVEIQSLHATASEADHLRHAFERARSVAAAQARQTAFFSFLDTYTVRHLGTLSAFAAMVPAVMAADRGATATATAAVVAGGSGMARDATEYAVTVLHLLVNVGLACRDFFVSLRKLRSCDDVAARFSDAVTGLQPGGPDEGWVPASPEARGFDLRGVDVVPYSLSRAVDGVAAPVNPALVRGLTLSIQPGMRVLVTGDTGLVCEPCNRAFQPRAL
jgi:ABC-type uncharacterized transport system fused permease/ATPase subunit